METVIIKVAESTIDQLNWLVARQERHNPTVVGGRVLRMPQSKFHTPRWLDYSTDWAQGGPIVERMLKDGLLVHALPETSRWIASVDRQSRFIHGPTLLIAAMRCYVASKLGDTAEVPDELVPAL